jgi:hypothetical protein
MHNAGNTGARKAGRGKDRSPRELTRNDITQGTGKHQQSQIKSGG